MRVLVFTMVFPSTDQPLHGIFVFERIRHLAVLADIQVLVPVPWFRAIRRPAPTRKAAGVMPVTFQRFWYIPKLLKNCRGVFLFLSMVRQVSRLRKTFDFDLIDAHFCYPDGFSAVLLGWWFRRPVCITLRGTIVQWSKRRSGRWLCDWAMRRSERVIAVAESLAQRALDGEVPEHHISVIPNGVDTERFRLTDRAAARKTLGLPERGRVLVSVGHISPRKGFHRVIRSLPRVLKSFPDACLVIVGGKGAEEDNTGALHALVDRLGLKKNVLFAGAQTPDKVAVWIGAADVFVLASDFEGCPNVVLEAMACGRPVVATKVGDIERMVPVFAGNLFDNPEDDAELADCVIAVLNQEWDAERIRAHVAARSWDDVSQRVMGQWLLALDSSGAQNPAPTARLTRARVAAGLPGPES